MDQRKADILSLEPKVKAIALSIYRRLPPLSVCLEDMIQEGWIGALRAQQHFDESRGVPFRLYATNHIRGAMLDYLRARDILSRRHRRSVNDGAEAAPRVVSLEAFFKEGLRVPCERGQRIAYARVVIARLMQNCSEQAELVFYHYFTLGRTQREIAERLGMQQTSVAHILRFNLKRMRMAATKSSRDSQTFQH